MRSQRIVQRQVMKKQLQELREKVATYKPFLDAQKVLDQAYAKGVEHGRKQAQEEQAARGAA